MLKPALQLRLGQQLTMTPQLQQAIRLLQLPVLELQAQIREALETNVMLEAEDEAGSLETGDTALEPQFESPAASGDSRRDPPEDTRSRSDPSSEVDLVDDPRLERLAGHRSVRIALVRRRRSSQEFSDARGETLQEHLTWQLEMSRLERTRHAHRRGDHRCDQRRRLRDRAAGGDRAQSAAGDRCQRRRSRTRPAARAGDGSGRRRRAFGERMHRATDATARSGHARTRDRIDDRREYLDQVADQQYALLRRQLRVTEEEMEHALVLVRACQPRPGSSVHSVPAEYIVPDVFVRRTERGWAVEINPASLPRIRVNQSYAGLIGRSGDHAMLRTQLQEARWLIRSLEIRNDTLLKVARCIVQRQSAFLENGDEYMQPMILKDVAEAVQMHESTISRVTTNKYMHTHRGVFEFRYFFSSHVAASDGTEMSSTAIRAKIRKLVAPEEPDKPLSDSRIAEILSQEGVQVARRTVAKYREALGIPPSSERKRVSSEMRPRARHRSSNEGGAHATERHGSPRRCHHFPEGLRREETRPHRPTLRSRHRRSLHPHRREAAPQSRSHRAAERSEGVRRRGRTGHVRRHRRARRQTRPAREEAQGKARPIITRSRRRSPARPDSHRAAAGQDRRYSSNARGASAGYARRGIRVLPSTRPALCHVGCCGLCRRSHVPSVMRLVIVSGLSGSGKSVALHMLEDLDYYCVDNIPAGLLPMFISHTVRSHEPTYGYTAVGVDARNRPAEIASVPQAGR